MSETEKCLTGKDKLIMRARSDFSSHLLPSEKVLVLSEIRLKAYTLANYLINSVPEGRELSSALSKLEEVMFHANAGISRQFPSNEQF